MLVGASYLVSAPIGLATTIAVCLHEIPQELGDFGVLVHAGFTRTQAVWLNFLTAMLALAGAALSLVLGARMPDFSSIVLPMTAGVFLYIAGSDLVPELHKERQPKQAAIQLAGIGVGIGVMLLLKLVE
jgi:zinc and cadmium transporter